MMFKATEKPVVVVVGDALTKEGIEAALNLIPRQSWKALIQVLNNYRDEHATVAATHAGVNNAGGAAKELGWYESLSAIIDEYDGYRTKPEV